jgi:transcription elongation factor GreB
LSAWSQRASELDQRIASAVCIDPESQPKDTVRFGSRVTVSDEEGHEQTYEIVGVDEAEPQAGRINFLSPLARALLGASVGDEVTVRTPAKPKKLEVIAIA